MLAIRSNEGMTVYNEECFVFQEPLIFDDQESKGLRAWILYRQNKISNQLTIYGDPKAELQFTPN